MGVRVLGNSLVCLRQEFAVMNWEEEVKDSLWVLLFSSTDESGPVAQSAQKWHTGILLKGVFQ